MINLITFLSGLFLALFGTKKPSTMSTNQTLSTDFNTRLQNFIEKHEGKKYQAYQDQGGNWTIGIGHLIKPNETWMIGQTIGESQVKTLFLQDIQIALNAIKRLVKKPLNENQTIALASFVFNFGEGKFQSSTLLKKLNLGDFPGAALEFRKWDKVRINGILTSSYGLLKRRINESNLFQS